MKEREKGRKKEREQLDTASLSSQVLRCCRPRNAGLKRAPDFRRMLSSGRVEVRGHCAEEHLGETKRVGKAVSACTQDARCPGSSATR